MSDKIEIITEKKDQKMDTTAVWGIKGMKIISWLSVESKEGTVIDHDFQKACLPTTWHMEIALDIC